MVTLDLTGAQLDCLLEQRFAVGRVLQPSATVASGVSSSSTVGPPADDRITVVA